MKKNTTGKNSQKIQSKKLSTSIIVALITLAGTLLAAILGYLGLRYQVDKSSKLTETVSTIPQLKTDLRWSDCFLKSTVIPDNVFSPEQNSYSTLRQLPDFNNWSIAPVPYGFYFHDEYEVIPLRADVSLRNTSTEYGKWIKVQNKVDINLDLVSSNIENHINTVFFKGGCGGGDYKKFSTVSLNQEKSSINQVITSKDYDFFQYQPGEYDSFIIEFVCETPGIYQASMTLRIDSSGISEEKKLTGLSKIICPKSYTFWITSGGYLSTEPLEYIGEYYWDGKRYVEKP